MSTYTTLSLVYWKFHSSNCPYHSFSITVFSLPLSINCDSNKSLFITLGNSDVRPDPELGNYPIQLEQINEKSCITHPMGAEDDVSFPVTLQTLYPDLVEHFIFLSWLFCKGQLMQFVSISAEKYDSAVSGQQQQLLCIWWIEEEIISCRAGLFAGWQKSTIFGHIFWQFYHF